MMNEQNRQVVNRLIDGINESDIAILDDILSAINHDSPRPVCPSNGGYGIQEESDRAIF